MRERDRRKTPTIKLSQSDAPPAVPKRSRRLVGVTRRRQFAATRAPAIDRRGSFNRGGVDTNFFNFRLRAALLFSSTATSLGAATDVASELAARVSAFRSPFVEEA